MSTASRMQGNWLAIHSEKLVFLLILVLLLGSSLFVVSQVGVLQRRLAEQKDLKPEPSTLKKAEPLDLAALQRAAHALEQPEISPLSSNRVMVSELRVSCITCGKPIPYQAMKCPFCGAEQPDATHDVLDTDGDGIPDEWELRHGLNPRDPSDALLDSDGDGYTNLEEFRWNTDPRDPAVQPPPAAKLAVERFESKPFVFRFLGVSQLEDGDVFQLNVRTYEKTYFAKLGDVVEGYKVAKYDPEGPRGRPALTLEKGREVVVLEKDRARVERDLVAQLVFLIDQSRFRVRKGEQITVKGSAYIVVDIKADGVLIRDMKTNTETLIGRAFEREQHVAPHEPPSHGGVGHEGLPVSIGLPGSHMPPPPPSPAR